MAKAKSSVDGMWKYMQEREAIRLRRAAGDAWPWTKDKILQAYKFTNVQREYDRTSKIFKSLYNASVKDALLLYNCGVARYFGTAEFYARVGWQSAYNPSDLANAAKDMIYAGRTVFTRAYVITNGGLSMPKEEYVTQHPLKALWENATAITNAITNTRSWEAGYKLLHKLEGFGGTGFMAKEVLMDYIQFSDNLLDWDSFTPVGPGAARGLGRILEQDSYAKVKNQLYEVTKIWLKLRAPWKALHPLARPLSCSDVQFCLCEYSKYEAARLDGKPGKNKYTRRDK